MIINQKNTVITKIDPKTIDDSTPSSGGSATNTSFTLNPNKHYLFAGIKLWAQVDYSSVNPHNQFGDFLIFNNEITPISTNLFTTGSYASTIYISDGVLYVNGFTKYSLIQLD